MRDDDVALREVIAEIRRGAIREGRRGAQTESEGQAVHSERERRDRNEGEEELREHAVETERLRGHLEAQRVRDGRGPESERGPEETGAQRATPASLFGWDRSQTAHRLAEARSLGHSSRGDRWSCSVVPLGHHPQAMSLRSEIAEQPRVVRRLLDEAWPEARALGRALARVEHITLVARGSSDNAATYGKYLLESIAGVVTALAAPSLVTRYQAPPSYAHGAVIGISQSGASPDVAGGAAGGRPRRARTLPLTHPHPASNRAAPLHRSRAPARHAR